MGYFSRCGQSSAGQSRPRNVPKNTGRKGSICAAPTTIASIRAIPIFAHTWLKHELHVKGVMSCEDFVVCMIKSPKNIAHVYLHVVINMTLFSNTRECCTKLQVRTLELRAWFDPYLSLRRNLYESRKLLQVAAEMCYSLQVRLSWSYFL